MFEYTHDDGYRRTGSEGHDQDDPDVAAGRRIAAQTDSRSAFAELLDVALGRVPGVRWASVTRGFDDRFETVASSHEVATAADALQYRLGTGPCLDAVIHESVFDSGDLPLEPRWSSFGPQAARAHGTRSVLSIRLPLDDERHPNASLNLYADHLHAFDAAARRAALTLVGHAAVAVAVVLHRVEADHLRSALASNREIGIAIGVLMATMKLTREQGFNLLRDASQSTNRKLRDVATDVADTGLLDPSARRGSDRR